MPKIGQAPDTRPYNLRCQNCGCLVEKMISRFGWDGKPTQHQYRCANPFHNCGTIERDGCAPKRVYDEPIAHAVWSDEGAVREHPGPLEECQEPECLERHTHMSPSGVRHPGRYEDCESAECEPPF